MMANLADNDLIEAAYEWYDWLNEVIEDDGNLSLTIQEWRLYQGVEIHKQYSPLKEDNNETYIERSKND